MMFGTANKTWKRQFRYWRQICLDCKPQSENTKLVLLWLDSNKKLNSKDIDDFLLFPTGVHTPSYDRWFRRYALLKLMNAAGILRWTDWRKLTISKIWPRFEMKTPETLDTKRVYIFLRFAMNIYVSHADKPSNIYDHWKIARGEIFDGNLKIDWVLEDRRRFGSRTEQR
jgi:hypothetical protein